MQDLREHIRRHYLLKFNHDVPDNFFAAFGKKYMSGAQNLQRLDNLNPRTDAGAALKNGWPKYIWLIALLPFFQTLVTWDFDGDLSGLQYALRHLSIPALTGEIIFLLYSLRSAFSPWNTARQMPLPVQALLGIWIAFAVSASVFQHDDKPASLLAASRFGLHMCFLAAMVHYIKRSQTPDISRWLNAISVGIICYIAALTIFALCVPEPATFKWATRLPSATNIRQIANIVAIPAAAPIALLLFGNERHRRASALWLTIIVTFLAWSGSRTALFAVIISIFSAMIFMRALPKAKSLAVLAACFATGLLASLPLPTPTSAFGLFRMLDKMQEQDNVSSGRVEFWMNTIGEISKHPWLGYGSGRFRQNMHEIHGTDFNHPHNFILQFTYDWGIFGAAAILSLLLYLLWTIIKRAPSNPLAGFVALLGISILCAIAMVDGAFFYPLTIIAAIILTAPILAHADKNTKVA